MMAQHHGETVSRGAHHRRRAAADADPGPQAALGRREDALAGEGLARGAPPRHRAALEQGREQVELLLEQGLVAVEVVAEEREGLGERPPPKHHFGAAARHGIEGREALEDADGVVRTQHRDGRAEAGMRRVRPAAAASTISGDETAKSAR